MRVQVRPAPLPVAVCGETLGPPYGTKATTRSPGVVVENIGVCMMPCPSTETTVSCVIVFGGFELSTVTVVGADDPALPVTSVAVTVMTCCPVVAVSVSQNTMYGG